MVDGGSIVVQLLGGFAVLMDQRPQRLGASSRAIVAALALQLGRPISRVALAEMLWPHLPRRDGRDKLRRPLWRLKQRGIVALDARRASLVPATVDLELLRMQAREAQDGLGVELDTDLFTKELLPGWTQDWVLMERERTHQVAVHALEAAAASLIAAGRRLEAIPLAEAAVRVAPMRASAIRLLSAALALDAQALYEHEPLTAP